MNTRRHGRAKIVATLGPASSTREVIRALVDAGADVCDSPRQTRA